MKIKKLHIYNIASIEDETIDFTAPPLSDSDVFLITGGLRMQHDLAEQVCGSHGSHAADNTNGSMHSFAQFISGSHYTAVLHSTNRNLVSDVDLNSGIAGI